MTLGIDIIGINGYAFPAHRGGPMFYAEQIGLAEVFKTVGDPGGRRLCCANPPRQAEASAIYNTSEH